MDQNDALISVLSQNLTEGVRFQQFQSKITLFVNENIVLLRKFIKNTLFSGNIYTAGSNFTQPPVATAVTNLIPEAKKVERS